MPPVPQDRNPEGVAFTRDCNTDWIYLAFGAGGEYIGMSKSGFFCLKGTSQC
jgi:hypothetical protein